MKEKNKANVRRPDFESISNELRAWINTTRDGKRTYLVIVDEKTGKKTYLNKTKEAKVSSSSLSIDKAREEMFKKHVEQLFHEMFNPKYNERLKGESQ